MQRINQTLLSIVLLGMVTLITFSVITAIDKRANRTYNPETVIVNTILKPYVDEYVIRLKGEGIKLPYGKDLVLIDFSLSFPNNILGVAWGMNIDNITVVQINAMQWRYLTIQQRRLLIWHELTHDIFDKYHGSSCIMDTPMPNRYLVTKDYVNRCIDQLVKQLKQNQDEAEQ